MKSQPTQKVPPGQGRIGSRYQCRSKCLQTDTLNKALAKGRLGNTLVTSSLAEWEGQYQPAGGEHDLKKPSKLRKWSE